MQQLASGTNEGLGYTMGDYVLTDLRPNDYYRRQDPLQPHMWTYRSFRSSAAHALSFKKIKEAGLENIPTNEPIAIAVFNEDAVPQARHLPENKK